MHEMITAPSVTFAMTPFVWHTDAAMFVFKDGKANIDREAVVPGKPMKVVLLGDYPNEDQVETSGRYGRHYGSSSGLPQRRSAQR